MKTAPYTNTALICNMIKDVSAFWEGADCLRFFQLISSMNLMGKDNYPIEGLIKDPFNMPDINVIGFIILFAIENKIEFTTGVVEDLVLLYNHLGQLDRTEQEEATIQLITHYMLETERFDHP